MKFVVSGLLILLLILHQDFWQRDDATLVFGWLPYSLFYHAILSVAAAFVWWLAVQFCWPNRVKAVSLQNASASREANA